MYDMKAGSFSANASYTIRFLIKISVFVHTKSLGRYIILDVSSSSMLSILLLYIHTLTPISYSWLALGTLWCVFCTTWDYSLEVMILCIQSRICSQFSMNVGFLLSMLISSLSNIKVFFTIYLIFFSKLSYGSWGFAKIESISFIASLKIFSSTWFFSINKSVAIDVLYFFSTSSLSLNSRKVTTSRHL